MLHGSQRLLAAQKTGPQNAKARFDDYPVFFHDPLQIFQSSVISLRDMKHGPVHLEDGNVCIPNSMTRGHGMFVDRIAQGSQKLHLSDGEYEVTDQDQEKQAKAASEPRSDTGVIEPPEGTEFHKGILSTGALSAQGTRSPWGRAAVFLEECGLKLTLLSQIQCQSQASPSRPCWVMAIRFIRFCLGVPTSLSRSLRPGRRLFRFESVLSNFVFQYDICLTSRRLPLK